MSESFDITQAIAPKSEQANAEDFLTGPRTFTIAEVRRGNAEQPVDIFLAEFDQNRPFKPSKTVLRILARAWGSEATAWVGRRMTLYRDPGVKWGGAAVGGIRVSHLSHISEAFSLTLTESKGKRAAHKIQPLPDPPAPSKADELREQIRVAVGGDVGRMKDLATEWQVAHPDEPSLRDTTDIEALRALLDGLTEATQ